MGTQFPTSWNLQSYRQPGSSISRNNKIWVSAMNFKVGQIESTGLEFKYDGRERKLRPLLTMPLVSLREAGSL